MRPNVRIEVPHAEPGCQVRVRVLKGDAETANFILQPGAESVSVTLAADELVVLDHAPPAPSE